MTLRVLGTDVYLINMRTRMPFRYGITTLTAVPHLFLRATVEIDGRRHTGVSADHLPPKWFTKYPDTTPQQDIDGLLEVIAAAGGAPARYRLAWELQRPDTGGRGGE